MRGKVIPFPQRPAEPERRLGFVEVRRCDRAEAVVVRSLLESEGIPVVLHSRIAHSVHPFTVGAQGEVLVLVPPEALMRTRRLLA